VDTLTVYAHPACSKSRRAVELLEARHARFHTVNYLDTPLSAEELGTLVDMLDGTPAELVRLDDDRFGELGLSAADVADRTGVIALLVAHPELMQRPVVTRGGRAVVARPPERLLTTFFGDGNAGPVEAEGPGPHS
jgi:arsenate reductase (glutaredoxin)